MKYGEKSISKAKLEIWDNPNAERDYDINISFPEFSCPRAREASVVWPDGTSNRFPTTVMPVFAGDSVIACATVPNARGGSVTLEGLTDRGTPFRQVVTLPPVSGIGEADSATPSTVARLCAALRLRAMENKEAQKTAVDYQLMSPYTSYIVVAERAAEKRALGLPQIRPVPHTLAAGWGGVGLTDKIALACSGSPSITPLKRRHAYLPPRTIDLPGAGSWAEHFLLNLTWQQGKQRRPRNRDSGAHGNCHRCGFPFRHPGETAS